MSRTPATVRPSRPPATAAGPLSTASVGSRSRARRKAPKTPQYGPPRRTWRTSRGCLRSFRMLLEGPSQACQDRHPLVRLARSKRVAGSAPKVAGDFALMQRHGSRYRSDPESSCVYSRWQSGSSDFRWHIIRGSCGRGVRVTRTPRGGHPPLVVGLSALGRARVSQEQEQGEAQGENAAYHEVAVDGVSDQKRLVHAEGLYEETSDGVKAQVQHEDVAGFQSPREAAGHPEQDQAHKHVPYSLVEEGRMERGRIGVLRRPVLRRYPYGPRQIREPSEKLLIEVVAPPTYCLAQGETRSGSVGEGERVYAPVPAEEEQA